MTDKRNERHRTRSNNDGVSINDNETERVELSVISVFKKQIQKQSELIDALKESFNFMSGSFDKLQKELKDVKEEQKSIKKEIKTIQQSEELLKKKVYIMEMKLSKQQQANNSNNMVITNLPKFRSQSDIMKVIEKISQITQYKLQKDEIIDCYQIESKNKKAFPIIIKLNNNKFKANCMKYRKEKNVIDPKKVDGNITIKNNKNINFYHFLEREYSMLFNKSKEIAKQKNYKFVWYANANIFMRKEENSKIIKIRDENDLGRIE